MHAFTLIAAERAAQDKRREQERIDEIEKKKEEQKRRASVYGPVSPDAPSRATLTKALAVGAFAASSSGGPQVTIETPDEDDRPGGASFPRPSTADRPGTAGSHASHASSEGEDAAA